MLKLISNPWFGVGVIVLWLASLGYVGYWQRSEGRTLEADKWQKALIQSESLYNAKLDEFNTKYRALENKRATDAQNLSVKYQQELKQNEQHYSATIADLRAGNIRLRDKYAHNPTCGNTVPETGSDSGRIDAGAGGELSNQAAEFLLSESKRADDTVSLLNRCIAQLKADRQP